MLCKTTKYIYSLSYIDYNNYIYNNQGRKLTNNCKSFQARSKLRNEKQEGPWALDRSPESLNFLAQGHNLNNLNRGPQGDATYQISSGFR